ncbi:MAG: 4Fe-4S dicluster domain-containing protein, partial [Bacteroidetes bacterium]
MKKDSDQKPKARGIDRSDFLKKFGSAVFASLFVPALMSDQFEAKASTSETTERLIQQLPELPPERPGEDMLLRMMRDVRRALEKPVEERHWIMVIDTRKCVGCNACTIACSAENNLPPGVVYRPVIKDEIGEYPNVTRRFIPRPCMQCENPPCTPVCPVNATFKRPDGIVAIDYERCIGCRYCLTACPYQARSFDWGEYYTEDKGLWGLMPYEKEANHEYGKEWKRDG